MCGGEFDVGRSRVLERGRWRAQGDARDRCAGDMLGIDAREKREGEGRAGEMRKRDARGEMRRRDVRDRCAREMRGRDVRERCAGEMRARDVREICV